MDHDSHNPFELEDEYNEPEDEDEWLSSLQGKSQGCFGFSDYNNRKETTT
jgi:hypothetical protein